MVKRLLKSLLLFVGAVLVLGVAGYVYFNLSILTVVNGTGENLSNMEVQLVNEVWWQGRLAPEESKRLFGTIDGSGSIKVSFDVAGRRVVRVCGYYVELLPVYEKVLVTKDALIFEVKETTNGSDAVTQIRCDS